MIITELWEVIIKWCSLSDHPLHEVSTWDIPENCHVTHAWHFVIFAMVCGQEQSPGLILLDTLIIVKVGRYMLYQALTWFNFYCMTSLKRSSTIRWALFYHRRIIRLNGRGWAPRRGCRAGFLLFFQFPFKQILSLILNCLFERDGSGFHGWLGWLISGFYGLCLFKEFHLAIHSFLRL